MIIKEIRIKNFRSYYGDNNRFELSNGLTLILGDNGDGKTTFFDALQWLFNTTIDKGNIDHMSEMRKSKMEVGEQDEVSVFMSFEHDGEKSVEKSFSVERVDENLFRVGKLVYKGYETIGSERVQVSGKNLIDRCYDAFIQVCNYSELLLQTGNPQKVIEILQPYVEGIDYIPQSNDLAILLNLIQKAHQTFIIQALAVITNYITL